jgi:hypothetical protein
VDVIVNLQDGSPQVWTLRDMIEDLLDWGDKPKYLIPMAYRWCSAISKNIRERRGDEPTSKDLSSMEHYGDILTHSLAIAFRHIGSERVYLNGRLSHTPHDEWMLDAIFTRGGDDAIANAMYVGIVDEEAAPSGSWTRRLLKLTERGRPFSPRLRWTILYFSQGWGSRELREAELEFVCLLNNLEVSANEASDAGWAWADLLIRVLLTPMGQGHLSSHCWLLLGNLISASPRTHPADDRQTEAMKSFEESQDLDKLETWLLVVWWSEYDYSKPIPIQDIERATLELFRQRPSAIPRFEGLLENCAQLAFYFLYPQVMSGPLFNTCKDILRRICDQAQVEQSRLG